MNLLLAAERTMLGWLLQDYRHRLIKQSTQRAYQAFAQQHPRWAASLFDEYFVMHTLLPHLLQPAHQRRTVTEPETPTPLADPLRLAQKWADQMPGTSALRARQIRELVPVAQHFLGLLNAELTQQPIDPKPIDMNSQVFCHELHQ